MPTIRATTTSALARPWTSSSVLASSAALTGASASPKPKPPSSSGTSGRGSRGCPAPSVAISRKPAAAQRHPDRGDDAGRQGAGQVAADDRADRQRDQEADQHQRRHQLRVGVDGGAGEERDVDQRRDQGRPDEEADQQRAPGGRTPQRAGRDQRRLGPAQVQHERDGGDGRAEQVPDALVGEDLHLRVGGGEGEDHPGQRGRQEQRPDQVGLAQRCGPSPAGRPAAAAAVAQRTTSSTAAAIATTPSGVSQRLVADERDEQLAPGQVAQQLRRLDEHERSRPRG